MCNKSASRTYPLCIAASKAVNPSPSFAAMSKRFAVTKNFASASLSDITAQCNGVFPVCVHLKFSKSKPLRTIISITSVGFVKFCIAHALKIFCATSLESMVAPEVNVRIISATSPDMTAIFKSSASGCDMDVIFSRFPSTKSFSVYFFFMNSSFSSLVLFGCGFRVALLSLSKNDDGFFNIFASKTAFAFALPHLTKVPFNNGSVQTFTSKIALRTFDTWTPRLRCAPEHSTHKATP
mmetsp:Transcript_3258/g.11666  ORF Transcript_3258/g.11666 Transcript_3258/m.11666 type:complete len:238 (-) Transcript_3258:2352-3065(-)